MSYTAFAAMNGLILRDRLIRIAHLFKCMELIATHGVDIPLNEMMDFAESSHFCLPISITKCMTREKLKEETNVEKMYPLPYEDRIK